MIRRWSATLAALGALAPRAAEAHDLGQSSGWNAAIACALAISLTLYGLGVARLWLHAGRGRGVKPRQVACFAAGWATIALALVSPLGSLSDELFAAHMVEHELLMVVAAPLLVVARPLGASLWAMPVGWRRAVGELTRARPFARVWNMALHPGPAWALHAATLWLWHAPALFQDALAHPGLHALQHVCFLGAALLYWWSLLRPAARAHRGVSILSLFGTSVHGSLLGALLALSQNAWYPHYRGDGLSFGLSPLEDQQLAGLIMWVPGGLVYVGAALGLMYAVLLGRRSMTGGLRAARA